MDMETPILQQNAGKSNFGDIIGNNTAAGTIFITDISLISLRGGTSMVEDVFHKVIIYYYVQHKSTKKSRLQSPLKAVYI